MERQQVNLRLSPELLKAIDERAGRYKLSRNAWIEKALERVVAMPSQVTQRQERF
jgi:predicted HicB family RNase H-like nuclease